MSLPRTGLYVGRLRHARHAPRAHVFTYPVFQVLLDIDRIPEAMAVSRFTSYNRWNWASFQERDHFGDPSRSLRERVTADAVAAGIPLCGGPIYLLTNLRYLGYCFNPVSFFYCYDDAGRLEAVLAEVNNTFGETCNYWLADHNAGRRAAREGDRVARRHRTKKVFHVSPFMGMAQEYEWFLTPPEQRLVMHVAVVESGVRMLDTTLDLRYRPWTAPTIRGTLVRHPWMTAKVIAAIHFEALRLHLKGIRYRPHPGTPASAGHPRTRNA